MSVELRPMTEAEYDAWLPHAMDHYKAMQLAEDEARRRGIPRVTLTVFGGNDVARNLYRSLGYGELAVYMMKRV